MFLSKWVLCTGHKRLIQHYRMSPALKQLLPGVFVLNDRTINRLTNWPNISSQTPSTAWNKARELFCHIWAVILFVENKFIYTKEVVTRLAAWGLILRIFWSTKKKPAVQSEETPNRPEPSRHDRQPQPCTQPCFSLSTIHEAEIYWFFENIAKHAPA